MPCSVPYVAQEMNAASSLLTSLVETDNSDGNTFGSWYNEATQSSYVLRA
jgi:hypothetical protein